MWPPWMDFENMVVSQSLSCVRLFATPWTAAHQASLPFIISQSLLKLMSTAIRCYLTISSSASPFSSCPQSFPAPVSLKEESEKAGLKLNI